MSPVWRSLLWKEWRESRWKLLSLTVILFALPVGVFCYEPGHFHFIDMAWGVSLMYAFVAPVYIAAGVCAGEASGGTLAFLQASPVDRRRWAFARLLLGWFTVVTPLLLLLGGVLLYLDISTYLEVVFPNYVTRNLTEGVAKRALFYAIAVPTSTYLWSVALGAKCSRELWAIAHSLGGYALLWITFGVLVRKFAHAGDLIPGLVASVLPGGLGPVAAGAGHEFPLAVACLVALVAHGGLLAWFLSQYGESTRQAEYSPKDASATGSSVIRKPMASRTAAILWMQWREIAPLAGACLALSLVSPLVLASVTEDRYANTFAESVGNALSGSMVVYGFLFTVIVGVGVFLRDLEPGLNAFWRSRPIPASRWFWTKYLSALAMLAVVLGIPFALAVALNPELDPRDARMMRALVLCGGGAIVATFATAVAATALVRHAVYACLLSTGLVLTVAMGLSFLLERLECTPPQMLSTLFAVEVVAVVTITLLAWRAVTRDWGWKQ